MDKENDRLLERRHRQLTEDNCGQRPDSTEAPNFSRQRKRWRIAIEQLYQRVTKPRNGRMVRVRKPHTGRRATSGSV